MSDIDMAFRDQIVNTVPTYPDDFLFDEDDPGPEPYEDYDEPDYVAEEVD